MAKIILIIQRKIIANITLTADVNGCRLQRS